MPTSVLANRGQLYAQASDFARALEAAEQAAELQMLTHWTDAYWGTRQSLDTFLARVAAARAAGERTGISWAYQEQRLRTVLAETETQMGRYARAAAETTAAQQVAAARAAVDEALTLTQTAVAESLPGLTTTFGRTNPAVLEAAAGFLQDGSVLSQHLAATLPPDAVDGIRKALTEGLAMGKSQDWMLRRATRAMSMSHGRAVTILRTESLRAYREASRRTYQENAHVLGTWTWTAALDSRTCVACAVMDGTEHPLDATLDGHPRCRCAMVPRTKTWEDLGITGLDDSRPPVRDGKAWLEAQDPEVQRGIMGRAKYEAWKDGKISLDDMVARHSDDRWGTMRTERSLKAITEGRNPNYLDGTPRGDQWDKWDEGRDVRVTTGDPARREMAERHLREGQTALERDLAQVGDYDAAIKARQAQLRELVPDAAERRKVLRTDYTLRQARENKAMVQRMADESAERVERLRRELADVPTTNLPDFDPDNPLKFYGDRVVVYDRSDSTALHLRELAEDVSPEHHRHLRDHYAASPDGGFYVGDRYITELDDLGHLRGVPPRGWPPGSSFDEVPGVYNPARRVCACGGHGKGHGSTSLALHEGGHALDDAYSAAPGAGGLKASESAQYAQAVSDVPELVRSSWTPYLRPDGNPGGHGQEAWAEGFAAWTKARRLPAGEQARAVARALLGRTPTATEVEAHRPLAAYYRSLR